MMFQRRILDEIKGEKLAKHGRKTKRSRSRKRKRKMIEGKLYLD